MRFRSEKGFTGIEISISIVLIFIFVSIIAILTYNFNSASKEVELRSEATYIAIDEIEKMKNLGFEEIANRSQANGNQVYVDTEEVTGKEGFYREIIIEDYADINPGKIPGIVKKVTVQIKYMFKGNEQKVELSTILAKESLEWGHNEE